MPQWIITDIDGCLSPEESVVWELDRFLELARLSREASAGRGAIAPLTLCTGRPQPYVEVLMKLLDVRAPAIAENGAIIYSLAGNRARYGPGVTPEKVTALRRVRAYVQTELLPSIPEAVLQFGKETQVTIFSNRAELFGPLKERIETWLARHGGPDVLINASHFYLNVSLKGVDKGNALREVLAELGVGRDEVAGIGDTVGDLKIRDVVGFFACPANAQEEIKTVADYVSPRPMVEGLLDILTRPEFHRA